MNKFATLMLVVMFGMVSTAYAQSDKKSSLSDEIKLDLDSVQIQDTEIKAEKESNALVSGYNAAVADTVGWLGFSGNWTKAVDRGDEFNSQSQGLYGLAMVRRYVGNLNLGRPIRFELGLVVKGGIGDYLTTSGTRFSGNVGDALAGIEFAFIDTKTELSLPRFAFYARLMGGYKRLRGHSSRSSYKFEQEVGLVAAEATLELYWLFDGLGNERHTVTLFGAETEIVTGFSPMITFWGEFQNQVHTSRRSTVTRNGGIDRHREDRAAGALRWYFWKFASLPTAESPALWEVSPYVVLGVDWAWAAGLNKIRDGHSVYNSYGGAGVQIVVNREVYLWAEGRAHRESSYTHREFVSVAAGIGFSFW